MRISIELTPRNLDSLVRDLRTVREKLPRANMINIPDLLRFNIRSWEGCRAAKAFYPRVVPHIRAIDIDPAAPLAIAAYLRQHGINEVLVVTGDKPQDMNHKIFPTTSLDAISKFKRELPDIAVYATLNPYRQSFWDERELLKRKMDAGADGFFTQPIFDLRLMDLCAELADPGKVFWGASPVQSEKSRHYWETTNRVVFPKEFRPTIDWNRSLAAAVFQRAKALESNIYFMPIRADLMEYLGGIV